MQWVARMSERMVAVPMVPFIEGGVRSGENMRGCFKLMWRRHNCELRRFKGKGNRGN